MVWIEFLLCVIAIWLGGVRLSRCGHISVFLLTPYLIKGHVLFRYDR